MKLGTQKKQKMKEKDLLDGDRMKKQEAILISAFTGFLLTKDFADVHKFCEDLLGRPIWTHEFAIREIQEEIKEKCKPLILKMIENETSEETSIDKDETERQIKIGKTMIEKMVGYYDKNR